MFLSGHPTRGAGLRGSVRALAGIAGLCALLSGTPAGAQGNAIVTVPLTVVTVPVPQTPQNPGGLEQKLVQIPDSSKLKINPDNAPTQPLSVVVEESPPLRVNTATGWGMSTDPQHGGKSGTPVCGGYWNGRLQDKCPPSPATFVAEAVGTCPAGSFVDLGAGGCYTCPDGYNRTGDPVGSATACSKADASVSLTRGNASFAGTFCPAGSFFDPIRGGECYSCPAGFRRSAAHIDAPNACFTPAGEHVARANRLRRTPWPHECSAGSFHDAWDGGGCWICPSGFRRTGGHIADHNACVQNYGEQHARATPRGKAECKAGEFHDPRNGGECWTCPAGTYRTVFPVDGPQACEQRAGVRLSKSTQVSPFSCPAGTFLDLISSREPIVRNRIEKQIAESGQRVSYGSSPGGTCWTCPPGYIRDIYHVAGDAACKTASIQWKPVPYVQPGLFGLDGANEVAQAVLADGRQIEALIAAMAADTRTPLAEVRKEVYDGIAAAPQASVVLATAMYARIEAAVRNPAQASAAERRLAAALAESARLFRVFIAQNALDMYDQWTEALMRQAVNEAQKAGLGSIEQQRLNQLAFKGGEIPPDFLEISADLVALNVGAPIAAQSFMIASTAMPQLRNAIFPLRRAGAAVKAYREGAEATAKVTKKSLGKILNKTLGKMLKAMGKLGPQILVDVTVEAVTVVIQHYEAVLNARPKLVTGLASAREPVDMLRELNADEGWLHRQWSMALAEGDRPPANRTVFAGLAAAAQTKAPAAAAQANAPKVWQQMPGAAIDIGMGGGTLWHIGTQAVQGGFAVYRWDGRAWVGTNGGAVRLDVDPQGLAWVVTDKGEIFRHNGSTWSRLPGIAKDIGIGANGAAWVIGAKAVTGGFEIFLWANNNWQLVPGGGVRIDVDPQGNAWVISEGGDVFRFIGSGWSAVPGVKARDIGIGADGSVFVTARDGGIHKWSGQAWVKRDGGLDEITVDAQGVPFGVNGARQIWMGYP